MLSTRFVHCSFHGFGQRAGDRGFCLLFWIRDCGSIAEELLENFAQGLGIVMPRADAEFAAKGADRFNLGFGDARSDWGKFKRAADRRLSASDDFQ